MLNKDKLKRLLSPANIAFVGGTAMAEAAKRCIDSGFEGEVWLINPRHSTLAGVPCFDSVSALPQVPDATFIGISSKPTVEIVKQLNACGAPGAICYASGFSEAGEDGEQLQAQLQEAAGDMALIGPNCYGLLDYLHGATMWPAAHGGTQVDKGVAIITQSGNFAYNLSMADRSLPASYIISVGNQACVQVADLIDALLDEPRVTAIGLHLEGIKDVPGFAEAANRALEKGIPIVALKSGTSAIGAQMAMSHTSSLAGSNELYDALFDRVGIIRVSGPVSFVETLKVVAQGSLPSGANLAALACSGGDAGLIADYSEVAGLQLPQPNEQQFSTLTQLLPSFATIANPLDFTTGIWGDEAALYQCVDNMLSPATHYGFLVLDFPSEQSGEQGDCDLMADVFSRVLKDRNIPGAVASAFPELLPAKARVALHAAGVPALQGMEDGITAVGRVVSYVKKRDSLLSRVNKRQPKLCEARAINTPVDTLNEVQSKQLLASYGLSIPKHQVITPGSGKESIDALSFPVAVKAVSSDLPHKTEAGAVKLKVQSQAELIEATSDIIRNVGAKHPDLSIKEILVEEMSSPPVAELIVGIKRENDFGLALVIGAGGILVELVKDSTSLLLPTSREDVQDALSSLKIYKLLQGFRGKPAGDIEAAVDAIMAIADYATENSATLCELDVNPLMVLEKGAVAVDALICQSSH